MLVAPIQAEVRLVLGERMTVLSASAGIEALLGFSAADFLKEKVTLEDRIHPDDADVAEVLFSRRSAEKSGTFNIRLRHADGRIRCVSGEYNKEQLDGTGKVALNLLLADANSLYAGAGEPASLTTIDPMMNCVGEALYFKNRNHVFTAANQTSMRSFSKASGNGAGLLGKTDYDLFPEEYADLYYGLEKKVLAGATVASEIHPLPPDDAGTKQWVNNLKYAVKDPKGAVVGLFGVAHDITGHQEVLERLRESEESLREAQSIAGMGSYWVDIATGMWTSSDVLDRLFGIDKNYRRTVEGWAAVVHPDDRAMMVEYFANDVIGQGKSFDKEYRIVRRSDGAVRWVQGLGRLEFDARGRPSKMLGTIRDITERKENEIALRHSEESLREAEEIAGLCSYELNVDTGIWKGSENLEAILGIDAAHPRTVAGWVSLLHPDDRDRMSSALATEIASHSISSSDDYRIVRPSDGALRWLRGKWRIEYNANGSPAVLRGTIQDITESKQAEIALGDSQKLLQLFIEHAPVAIAMLDRDMRYIAVSRRWMTIHGFNGRELIGHSHYELFPSLQESWLDTHSRALKGETIQAAEESLQCEDGTVRWLRRELRPWFTGDGAIGGIIIFAEDVTARRQAEAAERESNKLLQLLVEYAPVAIAMFDREMRYLAVSHRWAKDHSIADREIIGRSHYEINPEVPERWKETHRRGLAGERQRVEEDRYDRADGSLQWIRWEIIPWLAGDDTVGGIIMFYEDITQRRQAEAALRESKELLQLFIAHAPAALAMFDREMRYLSASRRWLEEYSLVERDIIGHSHYEFVPDIPERWKTAHQRGLAGETLRANEDRFERADGTVQWSRWEVIPWRASDGTVGGIILFAEDITKHRETDERLRLAASVFTNAREGITITDPNGNILEVNEMFTRITGYSREEALGQNPRLLKSGVQSDEFYANMWRSLIDEGHWSGEIWNRNKGGEIIAENLTINSVHDASGKLLQYVALFSDITQLKKHAQQLEHMTHYDVLTSLPNRVLLVDRLHQAMAQAKRRKQILAVAYLDLDGFKEINDEHGRAAGDRLLTSLAFDMKCALREGDTLARLGGDEFVAVLIDLDDAAASVSALDQLREAAAEPVQVGNLSLRVSASIGVTFYPQSEEADPDTLLRQADQAMYQAKLAGGNRYHIFDPEHDLTVRGRHENLEHIRQALASREFVLHYQPKVNMRTGKVVGVEALIRWQHPERGLLPPGMFLPVIEDHSLAIEVGEWVIDTALAQMERWSAAGLEIPVSVNVCALQLQQADFVDRLNGLLAAHPGVKPFSLEIEVLETSALQDVAQTSQVLNACHGIGVSFALDDFGTGYSSLTYLKRLPASTLKIDQSFVSDMLEDPENLNILEGVLGLASAFHRQVIAEGVETVEHGLMLLQLGCELAQGYGIARPMPECEISVWISSWRPDPRWGQVPPIHSGNRSLLYACVEHRAWIAAFESYLMGKRHAPPSMDPRQCRFGKWLEGERLAGRANQPACRSVEAAHGQLHEVAAEIFAAHARGRNSDGLGRLGELHYVCDSLLEQMGVLPQ
jgi:diguanylate cyclase (GGDEF)-like protein/PAS domain S-box-containing protein